MRALFALTLIAAGFGAAFALPPLWGALALVPGLLAAVFTIGQ